MRVQIRTGDRAVIIGVAAIALYERFVRDEEDLISRRVAAYRKTRVGRVVVDTAILVTALHLSESVSDEWDVFHHAMCWFRKAVDNPQ